MTSEAGLGSGAVRIFLEGNIHSNSKGLGINAACLFDNNSALIR
jgi:hypothetical protein